MFLSPSDSSHAALSKIFSSSSWTLQPVHGFEEALVSLQREPVPVVICEMEGDWKSLMERIDTLQPAPKVIVAARNVTDHIWADVLQSGGYHVLEIPWQPREVFNAVSQAWRSWNFACHGGSAVSLTAVAVPEAVF